MSGADYGPAIPMFVDRSRVFIGALSKQQFRYAIVIHKTACGGYCTASDVANYFATNSKEPSTHYVIGKDGTVVQCVREVDGAGGNCCLESGYDKFWDSCPTPGNINLCTFSIEHCDYSNDNSDTMPIEQIAASLQLVAYLVNKYQIPTSHIKGHDSISPQSRKRCPGNYPWDTLFKYLAGNTDINLNWLTTIQSGLPGYSVLSPEQWVMAEQDIEKYVGRAGVILFGALIILIAIYEGVGKDR